MTKKKDFTAALANDEGAGTTYALNPIPEVSIAPARYDYAQVEEGIRSEVERLVTRIKIAGVRGRNSFLEIGRELTRLKELVPHGQFQDICRQELDGMAPQTARNYMNVWVRFGHQPDTLSLFTQTGIYTLAAATIPEPVVEQIVEKAQEQVAQTGTPLTQQEVRAELNQRKPAKPGSEGDRGGSKRGGNRYDGWKEQPAAAPVTIDGKAIPVVTAPAAAPTPEQPQATPAAAPAAIPVETSIYVDAEGEVEQDPVAGHIAVLRAAIETAIWYAQTYNDDFTANNIIRNCDAAIAKMDGQSGAAG
jgi:hypothetical protein